MSNDEVDRAAAETSESSVEPRPPPPVRRATPWLWQWLWRTDTMRQLEHSTPRERLTLIHRARVAADVARRAQDSAEPFVASIDSVLCDLYRQSIHWSLQALGDGTWSSLPPSLIRDAMPDPVLAARVELAIGEANFENLASLPDQERGPLLGALRSTALALIGELEFDRRAAEAVWAQRVLRVGTLFVLLGLIAFAAARIMDGVERRRDLALGAVWRTSSTNSGVVACKAPEQECADSPDFFFHTQEEQSPWIEFDLRSVRSISAVRVDNRKDCCMDRAARMVIELGDDQKHWRTVAKRDSVFTSWLATFKTAQARYVRLRLESFNSLHLQRVRILP